MTGRTPVQRLAELGIELPSVVPPLAVYVPATAAAGQVWSSGQLPIIDGALVATGKLGTEIDLDRGQELARICALNALAAIDAAAGLDNVVRIVKATIFVASAPDFVDQPKVGNGASELIGEVFGDAGQHARSAVGVAVLPLDAPVEVELLGLLG